MNISIFGLGYVGSVCTVCFAKEGHRVIGVDIKKEKVDAFCRGESSIVEPGLTEITKKSVEAGNICATQDIQKAVLNSEISFVCVGTPAKDDGSLDTFFLKRVLNEIGEVLREKKGNHVVVIRSTILPGTTESVVIPTLEETSGKKAGSDFEVVFNPEFLREGCALNDFYCPPFIILGQVDNRECTVLKNLWRSMPIDAPIYNVTVRVAEMIKYTCNSFHALKITFANEIGNLCKALDIDSHKVMNIFVQDTKLNLSSCYLKPGFAFGGSCLPKDTRALTYLAKSLNIETLVLDQILRSNQLQIKKALHLILRTGKQKVGIFGLSFKSGTDDLRESPMVILAEYLLGKGKQLKIYDENVNLQRITGGNKEYIEHRIPYLIKFLEDSLEKVLQDSEVLVIGLKYRKLKGLLKKTKGKIVIDLVRILEPGEVSGEYIGIVW